MIPKLPNSTSLQSNLKKNLAGRDSNSSYGTQKLQNFSEELLAVGVSEVIILFYIDNIHATIEHTMPFKIKYPVYHTYIE